MIKHILNDSAVVKSVSSVDEYNEYTFSEPKNIKCNIEFAQKVDVSPVLSEQTHPVRMFCHETVNLNDVVTYKNKDYKAVQVSEYKDPDGNPMFYEVFLL